MPDTLAEVLRQIDPYVQLNDGHTVASVESRLKLLDPRDLTEYAIYADAEGRLLIYELDIRGYLKRPAVMVEQKPPIPIPVAKQATKPSDFGYSSPGHA